MAKVARIKWYYNHTVEDIIKDISKYWDNLDSSNSYEVTENKNLKKLDC